MANVLFVAARIPYPLSHGGALRLFNLSRWLSPAHKPHLAAMERDNMKYLDKLKRTGVYESITILPSPPPCTSMRRHFRINGGDYNRRGRPEYYWMIVEKLQQIANRHNIDVVIAFTLDMAEFTVPLTGVKKIVDDYDCCTLSLERAANVTGANNTYMQSVRDRIQAARIRRQESSLTSLFDIVTTISPVDRDILCRLNRCRKENIRLVPNGISVADWVVNMHAPMIENTVAFWGDLAFPPNRSAVYFFYNEVYKPYLDRQGVQWYIIGKNADKKILELARTASGITLTGYVDDLVSLVSRIPVMVNPMVMGGGLKNKVLEALAMKRGVVSTTMGVEAFPLKNSTHYLRGDSPAEFAEAVHCLLNDESMRMRLGKQGYLLVSETYSWPKIANYFSKLITDLVA